MNAMLTLARPYLVKLLTPLIVAAFAAAAVKLGTQADPALVSQTVQTLVDVLLYGVGGVIGLLRVFQHYRASKVVEVVEDVVEAVLEHNQESARG